MPPQSSYELTLIEADLRDASSGKMCLGLIHSGTTVAQMSYDWDPSTFHATFHGNAPTLPEPAHPTVFLHQALSEIRALQSEEAPRPTDVFSNHKVFLTLHS